MDDVKYVWATYRKDRSKLKDLAPGFAEENIDPAEFKEGFRNLVTQNYDGWWTIGDMPYGLVTAELPLHGAVMFLTNFIWFPWATNRQILEGAVQFINQARREAKVYEFAQLKDRKFWDHICRYGIMRPVGTSYELYEDGSKAMLYESKRTKKWRDR